MIRETGNELCEAPKTMGKHAAGNFIRKVSITVGNRIITEKQLKFRSQENTAFQIELNYIVVIERL